MAAPLLSYENLGLVQGSGWLFRGLNLSIGARDRLALIGRNGAGKTTLLKLIGGQIEPDEGKRAIVPGTNVVMLEQDPDLRGFATLRDFAISGERAPPPLHQVEAIADQLGIDLSRDAATASGGERRRAAICRALASEPDILLLDEPTNHLDIMAIDWLEEWLGRYNGAFIVISHDRTFLTRLTRSTLWLDRGNLRRNDVGFGGFEAWMEKVYADEARNAERLDARLKLEAHWLERGVTARRKRNQGRLAKLWEMRAERAAMIGPQGAAKLAMASDGSKTRTVFAAEHVTKSFDGRVIIKDFTLRIQRGDRIGIVGGNGAGKSTLLKLLTGEIEPDSGKITRAKTLDAIVIDQQRSLLSPEKTVATCSPKAATGSTCKACASNPGLSQGIPVRALAHRGQGRHALGRRAHAGSCWRANLPVRPIFSCSTSRPTTSTWKRSTCCRKSSPIMTALSSSSATTAISSTAP